MVAGTDCTVGVGCRFQVPWLPPGNLMGESRLLRPMLVPLGTAFVHASGGVLSDGGVRGEWRGRDCWAAAAIILFVVWTAVGSTK